MKKSKRNTLMYCGQMISELKCSYWSHLFIPVMNCITGPVDWNKSKGMLSLERELCVCYSKTCWPCDIQTKGVGSVNRQSLQEKICVIYVHVNTVVTERTSPLHWSRGWITSRYTLAYSYHTPGYIDSNCPWQDDVVVAGFGSVGGGALLPEATGSSIFWGRRGTWP